MDCLTYMCEEILIEILSRLPAKSLIRFMAVCRLWKSIITSPQFRIVSNRPTKLLVFTDRRCYSFLEDDHEENRLTFETDFPFKHRSNDSAVVFGSANGLLCIGITNPYRIIIWNPFIRKHVVIPDAHMDDKIIPFCEIASGFGGTTSGGDYKYVWLVELFPGGGRLKKAVDIYSLKAGTWRRKYLDLDIQLGVVGLTYPCALVRGRLHWIFGFRTKICSFGLEDEVFENKIMVPESIQSRGIRVNVIRESLAVITTEIEMGQHSSTTSVWVMEEYEAVNSWVKLCNIVLEEFSSVERKMVHLMKDGDELLLGLSGSKYPFRPKLVTYNPNTMKTRDFGGVSLSPLSEVCGFSKVYKESLVLLGDHRAVHENQLLSGQGELALAWQDQHGS